MRLCVCECVRVRVGVNVGVCGGGVRVLQRSSTCEQLPDFAGEEVRQAKTPQYDSLSGHHISRNYIWIVGNYLDLASWSGVMACSSIALQT